MLSRFSFLHRIFYLFFEDFIHVRNVFDHVSLSFYFSYSPTHSPLNLISTSFFIYIKLTKPN